MHQVILGTAFIILLGAFALKCDANQVKIGKNRSAPRLTGTYTDMHYGSQGGDLLGTEIKIVSTRKGLQGALQFAEGAPEELVIVDIQIKDSAVSFVVPESSPYAGEFTGTIMNGVLTGEFRFKSGGSNRVELKGARATGIDFGAAQRFRYHSFLNRSAKVGQAGGPRFPSTIQKNIP